MKKEWIEIAIVAVIAVAVGRKLPVIKDYL